MTSFPGAQTNKPAAQTASNLDTPTTRPESTPQPNKTPTLASATTATIALLGRYALLLALIILIIAFSIALPGTFSTTGNLHAIVDTQAVLVVIALALTIPLRAGEFDLSIGNTAGLTMSLSAVMIVRHDWSWPLVFPLAIAVGAAIGLTNALLVVKVGVNAFIATLGMGTVLDGITLAISNGESIGPVSNGLQSAMAGNIIGFPKIVYYALALTIILWYIYEYTPIGRRLLFVGGAPEATRLSGVPINHYKIAAFTASAILASLAGVLYLGQLGTANPTIGQSLLLPAFAAAFLGATSIRIGRFNSWGTVIGVYLIATGTTGLILLGASAWVEQVFDGGVLIIAITFARILTKNNNTT